MTMFNYFKTSLFKMVTAEGANEFLYLFFVKGTISLLPDGSSLKDGCWGWVASL